jgi:hypothetical protein
MLVKTLTLKSLPYIVGIAGSIVAAHNIAPSAGTTSGLQSDINTESTIIYRQAVDRTLKGDRLPIRQAEPNTINNESVTVPAQITPNPRNENDCKPPIDTPRQSIVSAIG